MYVNCGECGRRYYCQTDPAECDNLSRPVFTNADKIRSMSDEELADLINREISYCAPTSGDCDKTSNDCKACWLELLQQPAEETER